MDRSIFGAQVASSRVGPKNDFTLPVQRSKYISPFLYGFHVKLLPRVFRPTLTTVYFTFG